MADITASRRYAKALFALSREQQAVEAVRADFEALASLAGKIPEWVTFVTSPVGSPAVRRKILDQLVKGKVHDLTHRFLAFLDEKRRLRLLRTIGEEWMTLYDESMGYLRARVAVASPLGDEQLKALSDRLSARFDRKVILDAVTDPAIIGGFRVFIGDLVLDYSIETQLQRLKKRLIHA